MNGISKATKIIMKILEIGHWVSTGLISAAALLSLVKPEWLKYVMDIESVQAQKTVSVYDFTVNVVGNTGDINYTALFLFSLGACAIFLLMAFIFRNLYFIIKNSENDTPFSESNIKRLKRIGQFAVLVSVIGFVFSLAIRIFIGPEASDGHLGYSGLIMSFIILCLTEYFARGAKLEKETGGLL